MRRADGGGGEGPNSHRRRRRTQQKSTSNFYLFAVVAESSPSQPPQLLLVVEKVGLHISATMGLWWRRLLISKFLSFFMKAYLLYALFLSHRKKLSHRRVEVVVGGGRHCRLKKRLSGGNYSYQPSSVGRSCLILLPPPPLLFNLQDRGATRRREAI